MRILNVTETYAPFLEFGGPPVKVRALSEGLARRGHQVTVLTADWGLEKRLQAQGLAPVFTIESVVIEAGPTFFDGAVKQVGQGIESITAELQKRDSTPYASTPK